MPSDSFGVGDGQEFTVPNDVQKVDVVATGAGGGDGSDDAGAGSGGDGGEADVRGIPVTPGETLYVYVGSSGGFGEGGGAADVRQGGQTLSDRIAVGGGGGGGGDSGTNGEAAGDGGDGNGPSGNNGGDGHAGDEGGEGGTQNSGGAGGTGDNNDGQDGSFGSGGDGGSLWGGDGGDGWYGGGGGEGGDGTSSGSGGGGGGGSCYGTSAADSVTLSSTFNGGDGSVTISYALPPSNLSATTGYRSADLSWDAASGADSYNVYRDGSQIASGVSGTTYTDTGLSPQTNYSYTVTAVDSGTESGDSNTVSVSTDGAAPTDLATAATGTQIALSWTDTNPDEDGYEVHRSTEPGVDTAGTPVDTVASGVESYTDDSLVEGTEYHYRVVAVLDGERGVDSTEAAATTDLSAPTNLSVSAIGDESADISWTANHTLGETRVDLAEDDDGNWSEETTVDYTTESVTLSGLLNGQLYGVRVVAQTADAESVDQ